MLTEAPTIGGQTPGSLLAEVYSMTTARNAILSAAWLLALTLAGHAQGTERPEVQLQAAIKQELVDGDLKGAIEKFKALSRSADAAVAAQALVHLAACYDKLGQVSDARVAYERVVREHAAHKEASAEARAWLQAHPEPAGVVGVRIEQVPLGSSIKWEFPAVSPDGRFVVFSDWSNGPANLAIHDLVTGTHRLLTREATAGNWAENPVISSDGKQIAFRFGEDASAIRLIGADGTRARVLLRDQHAHTLAAWSPDGKHLAALQRRGLTFAIVLLSTADGSTTQLKSTGWQYPTIGGFSPDGRYLVYSLPNSPERPGGEGGIFALAVDGRRETRLVQGRSNDEAPLWSPDGRRVIFKSDRAGEVGLWSIRMADGQPAGTPELLRANVGEIIPLGFTRGGALYYTTQNLQRDAYLARFDPQTLAIANAELVSDRFIGNNFAPEISPDGTRVAFLRDTGKGVVLVIRSLSSGEERTLLPLAGLYLSRSVQWFPDGRSVLIHDQVFPRSRFRQVDSESGADKVLFEGSYGMRGAALSPDGQTLYYSLKERDDALLRIMRRRLATGEESEVHRRTDSPGVAFFGLSVSPDGTQLAYTVNLPSHQRALEIISVNGGTPREIQRADMQRAIAPQGALAWTGTGHLIVEAKCGQGDEDLLCTIPTTGGELRPLSSGSPGVRMQRNPTRALSADGRRLAFTAATSKQELWAIRNLLPADSK